MNCEAHSRLEEDYLPKLGKQKLQLLEVQKKLTGSKPPNSSDTASEQTLWGTSFPIPANDPKAPMLRTMTK